MNLIEEILKQEIKQPIYNNQNYKSPFTSENKGVGFNNKFYFMGNNVLLGYNNCRYMYHSMDASIGEGKDAGQKTNTLWLFAGTGDYERIASRDKGTQNLLLGIKDENYPLFKDVEIVDLSSSLAEPGSVDAVLTFRNLHNWLGPQMDTIFANSSKALKPGGLFGVVEHRAKPGASMEMMKKSGYVTEEHAIAVAKKHGFTLVARSEVNSNPKDSASHPGGVWTLPPSLRLKDKDREKYLEIGESDRMTLLFKKS